MYMVLDQVFDDPTRLAFLNFNYQGGPKWYSMGNNPMHERTIDIARHFFDHNNLVGYEMWRNSTHNFIPEWHVDRDERLAVQEKRYSLPICNIVYYPLVENLKQGGEFYTDDIVITPKTNRLIIMSPGIFHGVKPYDNAIRSVVAINPWERRPS